MGDIKLSEEQVKKELDAMLDYWEKDFSELGEIQLRFINNAISRGRIVFDTKTGHIEYKLRFPIDYKDKKLDSVILKPVTSEVLTKIKLNETEAQAALDFSEQSTGIPKQVLNRIELKDYTAICSAAGFFST